MANITPALHIIEHGPNLESTALNYASEVLRAEGINTDPAVINQEDNRHMFAVAIEYQKDFRTLRSLAALAFSDGLLGSFLLEKATYVSDEATIAKDFNLKYSQMYPSTFNLNTYIRQLRTLDKNRTQAMRSI